MKHASPGQLARESLRDLGVTISNSEQVEARISRDDRDILDDLIDRSDRRNRNRKGEVERSNARAEDVYDDAGQQQGFFGTFSVAVFKNISDAEIGKLFGAGFLNSHTNKKGVITAFRKRAVAVGAVHIKYSLGSPFFDRTFNDLAAISRSGRFDMTRDADDRATVAEFLAPRYLEQCGGLFLHDIMHEITNGYFKDNIEASFLNPANEQANNPELIREEFPTFMFNIGNQIHPVSAMLNPAIAAKKANELRRIIAGQKKKDGTIPSSGEQTTAQARLSIYVECAKGKPSRERFKEIFFEDAFHFLKNAQLDAIEKDYRQRNPRAPNQEINVKRTAALPKYEKIFKSLQKDVDPRLTSFLDMLYDSNDIPGTLFEILGKMTEALTYNLKSKGIINVVD